MGGVVVSRVSWVARGRPLVAGAAVGPVLRTTEPLSFWGGWDPETGEITDRRHPLSGVMAARTVLVLPETRGSSTTTAVLLESVRRGTSPAALITRGTDSFLALAAVVAEELYGTVIPVVALTPEDFDRMPGEGSVRVSADGRVELTTGRSASPDRS